MRLVAVQRKKLVTVMCTDGARLAYSTILLLYISSSFQALSYNDINVLVRLIIL